MEPLAQVAKIRFSHFAMGDLSKVSNATAKGQLARLCDTGREAPCTSKYTIFNYPQSQPKVLVFT
jgi:hypothetical protein